MIPRVIYDLGNTIQGVDANTSQVANTPNILTITGLAAGTTIDIQFRQHANSAWISLLLIDGATETESIVDLEQKAMEVRTVRSGAATPVVTVTE